jgi:site-specific recombinase
MFTGKKKAKRNFIDAVSGRSSVIPFTDSKLGLDFLVSFFAAIRPYKEKKDATKNMQFVLAEMQQHPVLLQNLQHAILSQLVNTDISHALTDSGIPLSRGFWQEFFGKLKHKLLPPLQNETDFLYVLNRVFFRSKDYQWVEDIPKEKWVRFFESAGLSFHIDDKRILQQLLQSLKVLAFQVSQLGLENEVLNYISEQDKLNNPFILQNYLVHDLESFFEAGKNASEISDLSVHLKAVIDNCYECINFIRENHSNSGASLHQTYILVILGYKLNRMLILADLLDLDQHFNTEKFVDFFRLLVRNENRKNSIREFLSQCLGYIAYQIAEHKGTKGNKYITASPAEYRSMFVSAMGGGAWVCIVVLVKNILTKIEMPLFWHGFFYSINYSAGFVIIEETHATLATKQPAFTASAVASSLDTRKNNTQPNLYNLAVTVAKVSRSQIASFAGNLIVAFPGTFLLAWLYHIITGTKMLEGAAAYATLEDQHPWHSLSLLYACNAGFFLFLSGIIAGFVQNKIQYSHIGERLVTHPLLRLSFSTERLNKIAHYIEKHAGSIIGNIALGFFLGMSGTIGKIFGIPFDVRHITIASGNTAIAVYGIGLMHISLIYLLTIILGVLAIGFFNFLISFLLAFLVAVKSRGVRIKDYPEFLGILWRYFKNNPLDFIRARKRLSEERYEV